MRKILPIFIFIILISNSAYSQTWSEVIKAVAGDRAANDQFGYSVSISGDYAIVGARNEYEDASGANAKTSAGSAYIFKTSDGGNTWTQVQKIVASDRAVSDQFGYSVSISGDYAIVGAGYQSKDASGGNFLYFAGSAYIFKTSDGGNSWTQVQKIVAGDRAAYDRFGLSVSISGDYAIVGAYQEDEDASGGNTLGGAGSAYIFKTSDAGNSWTQVQKIVAGDRATNDSFGYSVSISGGYAIVGANGEDEDASGGNTLNSAGSAYIFKTSDAGNSWTQVQKIVAGDRAVNDIFGASVSISGDYAIVGAYLEDEDAAGGNTLSGAGSAYIFKTSDAGNTWTQVQKIVAGDRSTVDFFGFSVSISGDYAIVGAYNESEDASGGNTKAAAGSAYIFKTSDAGNTWTQVQKIVAGDRAASDYFGSSVSISGGNAFVGAYQEDEDAAGGNTLSSAGSAYFFSDPSAIPSSPNNTLNFDGVNDGIVIANNALLNFGASTDFTLEAKIKITGTTQNYDGIIAKANNAGWVGYQLVVVGDNLAAELNNGTTQVGVNEGLKGTTNINDGNWHHVAMVVNRSATNVKLFVDGNQEVNVTHATIGNNLDNTGDMFLGADRLPSHFIPANIDEVRVWSVARTQTEIQNNMNNAALSASTSGLVAYYHFDQGTAGGDNTGVTTLTDATSNNLDGTLYSFALTGSTSNWITNDDVASLPVELTTFSAFVAETSVNLTWNTATEVNNYGFEIERKNQDDDQSWEALGFVEGHGNSNSPKDYGFVDSTPLSGTVSYRLKQIDIDGKFEYSDVVVVKMDSPKEFKLVQNYPNLFNPSTLIRYEISDTRFVSLKVYNSIGQEVATLVNKKQNAGSYNVVFNAGNLSSGIYFYSIRTEDFVSVKKMLLLK